MLNTAVLKLWVAALFRVAKFPKRISKIVYFTYNKPFLGLSKPKIEVLLKIFFILDVARLCEGREIFKDNFLGSPIKKV